MKTTDLIAIGALVVSVLTAVAAASGALSKAGAEVESLRGDVSTLQDVNAEVNRVLGNMTQRAEVAEMVRSANARIEANTAGGGSNRESISGLLDQIGELEVRLDELVQRVQNVSGPIGSVVAWPGESATVPDGWHVCSGVSIQKARYLEEGGTESGWTDLWRAVSPKDQGRLYGNENRKKITEVREIHLPDYRGYFLRGTNGNATLPQALGEGRVDPDVEDRVGAAGEKLPGVGSFQLHAVAGHRHEAVVVVKGGPGMSMGDSGDLHGPTGQLGGNAVPLDEARWLPGNETRPVNIAVYWIIRLR